MLIIHPPDKPLIPTRGPEDWKAFLAQPEKHWKDGRSAKMLAECWEASQPDLPKEFQDAFAGTPFEFFVPLIAIPEYRVDLPGGTRPSQNDIFVLGQIGDEFAVIMVEGKVDESFGPLLGDWLKDASPGKKERLEFLQSTLGLSGRLSDGLRYQLLHRTASPLIEADRFSALYAAMVVHSFSESDAWLEDYQMFARLMGIEGVKGKLEQVPAHAAPELWMGWVTGGNAPKRSETFVTSDDSLPRIVAHADWGSSPAKRWMCVAERSTDGQFHINAPEPVGDAPTLLRRLRERAGGETVVAGFDFPIGVPVAYARRAGIEHFKDLLPELGHGRWQHFYAAAESENEISLTRPFYPQRPGGTKRHHLTDALGVDSMLDLLRVCERANDTRGAASPIFWTLGGKQVGKAAIIGWREVLGPALRDPSIDVSVWPFDGSLLELMAGPGVVIAETYPAEACLHLGMTPPGTGWSKTSQEGRLAQRDALLEWVSRRAVSMTPELAALIDDGFGASKGADPFDATIGLMSMLEVVLGHRPDGAPDDPDVRRIEGWILGQSKGPRGADAAPLSPALPARRKKIGTVKPDAKRRAAPARTVALAQKIVSDLNERDRATLYRWAVELLEIRAARVGRVRKAAAAIRASLRKGTIATLVRRMHGPIKQAGLKGKQLLWDDWNWATRLALSGVTVALATGGAEAGAGIAALGGAIGVPLWLVTASGGAFLGTLADELRKLIPKARRKITVQVDWEELDRLLESTDSGEKRLSESADE